MKGKVWASIQRFLFRARGKHHHWALLIPWPPSVWSNRGGTVGPTTDRGMGVSGRGWRMVGTGEGEYGRGGGAHCLAESRKVGTAGCMQFSATLKQSWGLGLKEVLLMTLVSLCIAVSGAFSILITRLLRLFSHALAHKHFIVVITNTHMPTTHTYTHTHAHTVVVATGPDAAATSASAESGDSTLPLFGLARLVYPSAGRIVAY